MFGEPAAELNRESGVAVNRRFGSDAGSHIRTTPDTLKRSKHLREFCLAGLQLLLVFTVLPAQSLHFGYVFIGLGGAPFHGGFVQDGDGLPMKGGGLLPEFVPWLFTAVMVAAVDVDFVLAPAQVVEVERKSHYVERDSEQSAFLPSPVMPHYFEDSSINQNTPSRMGEEAFALLGAFDKRRWLRYPACLPLADVVVIGILEDIAPELPRLLPLSLWPPLLTFDAG